MIAFAPKMMSRFRRYDIVDRYPSYLGETCFPSFPIVEDELDLLAFPQSRSFLFEEFDPVLDLIPIEGNPFRATTRRISRRFRLGELYLQSLCDRVSDLELGFDRLIREENAWRRRIGGRKYSWTAEIKSPENGWKYEWTSAIKEGNYEKKGSERSYKWMAEVKGNDGDNLPIERTYTVKVFNGDSGSLKWQKLKGSTPRIIEVDEPSDRAAVMIRRVFNKGVAKRKSKRKELSRQDAASLIQMNFRAHHLRAAHALRATRDLAVAKNKLKDIRASLYNFTYRRCLSQDAEERHRFSQKIIVLLLTVDSIEGADLMIRIAKKYTLDELESMLDIVDPLLSGKSLAMRRRTFDFHDGKNIKEFGSAPAKVVRMLDQGATPSETLEACL